MTAQGTTSMRSTDFSRPARCSAHDDVAFLASSWNRFDVLEAVSEGPQTRTELKQQTDVSRVTLSRILADLEEREWIRREADRFEATARGTVIAMEVSRLLDDVLMAEDLGTALKWLPTEQFDFELRHLRDATIITPDQKDLTAPTRKLVNLAHQCTRIRGIPTGITHEFIAALRDETATGDLSLDLLLPTDVFEIVSNDTELQRQFLDMVDSGNAKIFHYQGETPLIMAGIFDEQVMVCGYDESDAPAGTIETTNETILSWAESYFDTRCAEAHRLEPTAFTG
jgi:predicted transcriptional regulator